MNKKLKAILNVVIYSVLFYIILYSLVALLKFEAVRSEAFYTWYLAHRSILVITNDIISLILFAFLIKFTHKEDLLTHCKFKKINFNAITVLTIVGLCAGIFTGAIVRTPFVASAAPSMGTLVNALFDGSPVTFFLLFLIIGSIYKEVFFRGILFNELKIFLPFSVALILQGLMYGVFFFQTSVGLVLYGLLGAVLFAMLYKWFDSMWAPVSAQITSTGGMYLLYIMKGSFVDNNSYLISLISFIAVIGGIYYLIKNKDNLTFNKEIAKSTGDVSKGA
ncbi:MAG: CPBP family intramembrane glutamic endopeptidase [Lutisporaceae bacterium]